MEEGDEDLLVPTRPSHQACPEDDYFLAALDKMVNENIAESKNVVRDKNVMSSMTGPVSGAKGKKNWEQLQQESEASDGVQVRNHSELSCHENRVGDFKLSLKLSRGHCASVTVIVHRSQ